MTQKPEGLLWNRVRKNLPSSWHITRIENRLGGGIPDVHICANHLPFWIELKVTKTNRGITKITDKKIPRAEIF